MITQPIRAWSLKFVAMLCANDPLWTFANTSWSWRNFFAKYRIIIEIAYDYYINLTQPKINLEVGSYVTTVAMNKSNLMYDALMSL